MKILFVWTGVTGYMADCWRNLRDQDGVELKIVVETADSGKAYDAGTTLSGLDCTVVPACGSHTQSHWDELLSWNPDVVFAGGWRSPSTRRMLELLPDVPKVFCLDMPWRLSLRCFAARFVLRKFLRQFDMVFVPGRMSRIYARWLGFARERVRECLYAVDVGRLREAAKTYGLGNRRGFLYVGRYSPEKRVDIVKKAYDGYRALGGSWALDCYGQGGRFVQPGEMPRVYAEHACLLLASSFDPWPLVMLEAKASGMEVIASDRCGNCDELHAVKVPYGNVSAMARAMLDIEKSACGNKEPRAGERYLDAYGCGAWSRRVLDICVELRKSVAFCPGMEDPSNGMAVVARKLVSDCRFRREYIVHGAWLPGVWMRCLGGMFRKGGYIRMTHGAYSPVYLEGRLRKRLVRPLERFFLRRAKKVLVTCQAEKEWVESYEPEVKTRLIDLRALDWSSASAVKHSRPADSQSPLRILYLGRRHPLKGIRYLEEAVRGLNASESFSGPGRFELRTESDVFANEKEEAFAWCDVVCLPTLSENFGIVIAEALARGKPVVTTDGAPAWKDEPRKNDDGSVRLVVLDGFCRASDSVRVGMLREALAGFA